MFEFVCHFLRMNGAFKVTLMFMASLCAILVTISGQIRVSDHVVTAQVCLVMEYAEGGSLYNGRSTLISLFF